MLPHAPPVPLRKIPSTRLLYDNDDDDDDDDDDDADYDDYLLFVQIKVCLRFVSVQC